MGVLSFKKWAKRYKNIFHEQVEKMINYFAKLGFSVFEGAVFGSFEHTKTVKA